MSGAGNGHSPKRPSSWPHDLGVGAETEAKIREFLNTNGFEGTDFEAKTRSGTAKAPVFWLETWSVLEKRVPGWLRSINPYILYMWSTRAYETVHGLKGRALAHWRDSLLTTGLDTTLRCPTCLTEFTIPITYVGGKLAWQVMQHTNDPNRPTWHSVAFSRSEPQMHPFFLFTSTRGKQLDFI